jgi:hypothetical protein
VVFKVLSMSLAAIGLKRTPIDELYHAIATQSPPPSNKFNKPYGSSGALKARAIAARSMKTMNPNQKSDFWVRGYAPKKSDF